MLEKVFPKRMKELRNDELFKKLVKEKDNRSAGEDLLSQQLNFISELKLNFLIDIDSIGASVFMLIHSLLPRSRINKKSSKQNTRKRLYSVEESQDSFMSICATETEYNQIRNSKLVAESSNSPSILLVGSLEEPQSFMVCFENVTYKFCHFSKAIDVCFKAYKLFNIAYSEACVAMWDFIGREFYELHDGTNAKPGIDLILNQIKCKSFLA